jgi:hypothetical protein
LSRPRRCCGRPCPTGASGAFNAQGSYLAVSRQDHRCCSFVITARNVAGNIANHFNLVSIIICEFYASEFLNQDQQFKSV